MKHLLIYSLLILSVTACKKDEVFVEGNDEEIITTIKMTFTPAGGGTSSVFQFRDADGPGGTDPVVDEIILAPSQSYDVSIEVLNETTNPVTSVTEEIEEEGEAHRFYFIPSGVSINIGDLNTDVNGLPLGTTANFITSAAGSGSLNVVLRHYPSNPTGKELNDPVNSPKSNSDIDIVFDVTVQ